MPIAKDWIAKRIATSSATLLRFTPMWRLAI